MISRFLNYIEIKTKITSVLTFLFTILFLLYKQVDINWGLTALFFTSMLFFDLTTTAINNYIDTKTNTQVLQFNRKTALIIIYVLFAISTATGLYLAWLTDLIVLAVGALCFIVGVLYTYGPIPISRQPLGEVFSGLFYGFFIPFLIFYINLAKNSLVGYSIDFANWDLSLSVKLIPLVELILFAIIPFSLTANIMLTNNICDLEKDIQVKRYTLPYYLGKKALWAFVLLCYLPFVAVILLVAFGLFPLVSLGVLLIIPIIYKNMKAFLKVQDKETTFNISIKNFILISSANILMLVIALLIR
ncbi:MAG: UbiA family prenyltransferase [Clostridiales bacterium]|nr:UbiA family prenyltransferase [Clostridiales bacterium]